MNKVFHSYDQEELTRVVGQMATLVENSAGVKKASSDSMSRKMLEDCKPDKDHALIHLIAMGDHERYAFNKNGDAWPKAACEKYHGTFVTHGHLFREHRNRDAKTQGIGQIKSSCYNAPMGRIELAVWAHKKKASDIIEKIAEGKGTSYSMSCFPAGTLVKLPGGVEKSIELVAPGELLVTHHSHTGKVSHTMEREVDELGVQLFVYGLPDPVVCTANHGIWTRPERLGDRLCPVCGQEFDSLPCHMGQKTDTQHKRARLDYPRHCEGFRRADALKKKDWLCTPFDTTVNETGNPTYAALLGWYLAEGYAFTSDKYTESHHCVDFTLGSHEPQYAQEIKALLFSLGAPEEKISIYEQTEHSRIIVRCRFMPIVHSLAADGGKLAGEKTISRKVMCWSPTVQKIILEKFLEGDGSWHKTNETVTGITVSRSLAFQLAEIGWRNDLLVTVGKAKAKQGGVIKGRQVKSRQAPYSVSIRGDSAVRLSVSKIPSTFAPSTGYVRTVSHLNYQQATGVRTVPVAAPLTYIENGKVWRRIRKINRFSLKTKVFDLTVPGDHSFVANGIAVSNCRVPVDRSSITGKLAKNPGEYDEFTKYRMGQWIPEHNKFAFVYNDDPTFFDISYVKNPADRIAHHLEYQMDKAASAFMNSVDLAALEGVCIPDELRTGCLSFSRQADLVKLAALEEYLDAVAAGIAANDSRSAFCKVAGAQALSEQLSEEQLQAFRALQPGTLFRKLAKRIILLPFESFASYVLNKPVANIMEDASVKEAAAALPALFRKMAEMAAQSELENVCDAGSEFSSMADLAANDPVDKLLDKAGEQLSAEPEKVRARVLDSSSQCQPMNSVEKLASLVLSPEASTLLQTYGFYKLAALETIESIHEQPTHDGLHLLAVLQNRK